MRELLLWGIKEHITLQKGWLRIDGIKNRHRGLRDPLGRVNAKINPGVLYCI